MRSDNQNTLLVTSAPQVVEGNLFRNFMISQSGITVPQIWKRSRTTVHVDKRPKYRKFKWPIINRMRALGVHVFRLSMNLPQFLILMQAAQLSGMLKAINYN